MTFGLGLGILLMCLVQAEHVCCSWVDEAQRLQRSKTHAGFPLPDGRLGDFSSYPQNQLRQGFVSPRSVQSSSFNVKPVNSGYGPGLSSRSNTQALSQPAQSSVRLMKVSSVVKPSWQSLFSPRGSPPTKPRQVFGLSTAVASGASMSQSREHQKDLSRGGAWPGQQGSRGSSKYPSSSSTSAWSPSRESLSGQSAAQKPSNYGRVGSSAVLFGPVAPGPRGRSVRMQTYARAPAKRVISTRRSGEPARGVSSQAWAGKPLKGHLGSRRPTSQLQSYKPGLVSQIAYNPAVPRSSALGASAPAAVHDIPDRFGGSAIRRLREPAQQNQMIQKPQISTPLQWLGAYDPNLPSAHPDSKWSEIKLYTL